MSPKNQGIGISGVLFIHVCKAYVLASSILSGICSLLKLFSNGREILNEPIASQRRMFKEIVSDLMPFVGLDSASLLSSFSFGQKRPNQTELSA